MNIYKIVLSFVLIASSNFMLGMDQSNIVEIFCNYVYGNNVEASTDEKIYRVPCNTPAYPQINIEELYDYPSREEVIAMFNGEEFNQSIKIDVKKNDQEIDTTLFDSPQSIATKLSPNVKSKKRVTFHPYEVVQQKQCGNRSLKQGILKKN